MAFSLLSNKLHPQSLPPSYHSSEEEAALSSTLDHALPHHKTRHAREIPDTFHNSWIGITHNEYVRSDHFNHNIKYCEPHILHTHTYYRTIHASLASYLLTRLPLQNAILSYCHASYLDPIFKSHILGRAQPLFTDFLLSLYWEARGVTVTNGLTARLAAWCMSERYISIELCVWKVSLAEKELFNKQVREGLDVDGEQMRKDFVLRSRALLVFKRELRGLRRGLVSVEAR